MGLGLTARAAMPAGFAEEALERVAEFLANEAGDLLRECQEGADEEGGLLLADLHPGEEALEFHWRPGQLEARANTSTAGPGYHEYICGLLDRMAEEWGLNWEVEDETGYFAGRERERLEAAMDEFLRGVCEAITRDPEKRPKRVQVGMTPDSLFQFGEGVLTPMGLKSWEWAERVARGEEEGREYFSWWGSGEDADFYLGRTLCLMWSEVRWKAPQSEEEVQVLEEVVANLERAREADPAREYPWREWNEVLTLLEREALDVPEGEGELIGYRRGWVREGLAGGWSILLPGDMDGAWEEGTWTGMNGSLTVQFQKFQKEGPKQEEWTEEALRGMRMRGEEEFDFERDGLVGKACVYAERDEEGDYWQLDGRVARTGKLAVLSVQFGEEEQKEDALKIWRSLYVRG